VSARVRKGSRDMEIVYEEVLAGIPYEENGKLYSDVWVLVIARDNDGVEYTNDRQFKMRLYVVAESTKTTDEK
jgi:hypothetical protein